MRGRAGSGLVLRREDLRKNVREGREGNLVLFVVDASVSMAARRRMCGVKGAVLREREIHRLLKDERVLGLSLIKGTRWDPNMTLP